MHTKKNTEFSYQILANMWFNRFTWKMNNYFNLFQYWNKTITIHGDP